MRNIEVVEESNNNLERKVWEFTILSIDDIKLNSYVEQFRPTRRHKYRNNKIYSRLDYRRLSNISRPDYIPEHILSSLIDKIVKSIRITD